MSDDVFIDLPKTSWKSDSRRRCYKERRLGNRRICTVTGQEVECIGGLNGGNSEVVGTYWVSCEAIPRISGFSDINGPGEE